MLAASRTCVLKIAATEAADSLSMEYGSRTCLVEVRWADHIVVMPQEGCKKTKDQKMH